MKTLKKISSYFLPIVLAVSFSELKANNELFKAAQAENIELVTVILKEEKILIDFTDHDGTTSLWWAAFHNNTKMVALLLEHKANPNMAHNQGSTPLWYAAYRNNTKTVALLLKHGANININADGTTPLWWAKYHNNSEIIDFLEHPKQAKKYLLWIKWLKYFSKTPIDRDKYYLTDKKEIRTKKQGEELQTLENLLLELTIN